MDTMTGPERSALMSRIQGGLRRNSLERALHGQLCARHVRHEMQPAKGLRMSGARPDAVVRGYGVGLAGLAVYVNGCFWHGCPSHFRLPKTRKKYWREKVLGNVRRQKRDVRRLRRAGFSVAVLWEHDMRGDPGRVVSKMLKRFREK